MRRLLTVFFVLVVVGLAGFARSSTVAAVGAQQQNAPGLPTVARMYILNKDRTEAVPVKLENTGDVMAVTVVGAPTVALLPNATIGTRAGRQVWEYRQLVLAPTQDPTVALNAAGVEGWEAVCATVATPARTVWVLKRPQ